MFFSKDALRYVKITDMKKFKDVLAQVGKAYTTMVFNKASDIAKGPSKNLEVKTYK